jgi:DNA repair protein RadC
VGGPTANFRHTSCDKQKTLGVCKNKQCLYPTPCKNLNSDHSEYLNLLRKIRAIPGVKKVFVRSGIRFDYLLSDKNDNLIEMSKLNINELMKYNGIGEAKAVSIMAALELGRRRRYSEALEQPSIKNSKIAYECFYAYLSDLNHEQFWIMLLNNANKIIKLKQIGVGGMTGTTADPKKIFKCALENNAASVMLCHNHPSGNTTPSNADKQITNNLIKAGQFLEIKILDHIIIGNDNYFSFADEGLL